MHFYNVHFVVLCPVGENDMDRNQVFQVHAEDGDLEALAVGKGPAVATVIAVGGDQLCHFVPVLGTDGKGEVSVFLSAHPQALLRAARTFLGH